MAERFVLFELENLRDRFALPKGVPTGVKISYNVSPTQLAPVIVSRDGERIMERKMWGLLPATAKDTRSVFRYKTTVVKSESVLGKHNQLIRNQRCIVPVNGYYEWRKTKDGKRPFYVQLQDQPLVGLAGIYSTWTDATGKEQGTFAIITAEDDSHTGRSPIVIPAHDEEAWLDPAVTDVSSIYSMLRPLSSDMLSAHKVTSDLKNSKLNSPALLEPVA